MGPDTANSSSRSGGPSQTQREVSALNERLADAEAVISRQESELDHAKSQASALRSEIAHKRVTTQFIDQHQLEVMITQANKNRSQNIEAQLRILEDQLDQTAVNLELAEGKKEALQSCKHQLVKDQADLRDLRQIVAGAEHNVRRHERLTGAEDRVKGLQDCKKQLAKDQADLRDLRHIIAAAEYNVQRHERLTGAEDRVQGLLRNMEKMMARVMEQTRVTQARSSATPVGMSLDSCRSSRQCRGLHLTALP